MNYRSVLLSGLPGSGKSTLARRLSHEIGWDVRSIGQYFREEWGRLYPHQEVPFPEYWRNTTNEENLEINRKMRDTIENGNVICDSRYPMPFRDLNILLVFIEAPIDMRASRISERYNGISHKDIIKELQQREDDEVRRGVILFQADYRDPMSYHLTLNSSLLTVEQELSILKSVL